MTYTRNYQWSQGGKARQALSSSKQLFFRFALLLVGEEGKVSLSNGTPAVPCRTIPPEQISKIQKHNSHFSTLC